MSDVLPETRLGQFLTLRDFCTCTQTYKRFADKIDPYPKNPDETIPSLSALCAFILDPVISQFGLARFKLTYGFCSSDLKRWLAKSDPETGIKYGMSTPGSDQHMAHEKNRAGAYFCARLGASCDFRVTKLPSDDLVTWIVAKKLPFDSLYYYGPDRPVHVSHGPQNKRDIRAFLPNGVPTLRGTDAWRKMLAS